VPTIIIDLMKISWTGSSFIKTVRLHKGIYHQF
jgi:hypothetical protein